MSTTSPNSLTGVWYGQFSYPAALEPGDFVAVLLDIGGRISGTTHEPDGFGVSDCGLLYAVLDGRRDGVQVSFCKTYDGAHGVAHTVDYQGELSADGTEIEGRWTIPGAWSGRFLMIRSAGREQAVTRESEATVR